MSRFDRFFASAWPYGIVAAIGIGGLIGVAAAHVAGLR